MSEVLLTGLDGSNPQGFLAALGVLNVVSDHDCAERAQLSWRDEGIWRPVLHHPDPEMDVQKLVAWLHQDLVQWREEPVLRFRYGESGSEVGDLKPPPGMFREFLLDLVAQADPSHRTSVDHAAALATDVAVDLKGNTKPTALHFTAGNQKFLEMVNALCVGIVVEDLMEALVGPWRYARKLPVLQWDNTVFRDHALRASDPAKEKKAGNPGAEWMAFRGLSFLRVAPAGRRILTAGCAGGWKNGCFRWPLWSVPLSRPVARTLVQMAGLAGQDAQTRRARGIAVVFESGIRRLDQGGYGSFAPARVI